METHRLLPEGVSMDGTVLPEDARKNFMRLEFVESAGYAAASSFYAKKGRFFSPVAVSVGKVRDHPHGESNSCLQIIKIHMNDKFLNGKGIYHRGLAYIFAAEEAARLWYLQNNIFGEAGAPDNEPLTLRDRRSGELHTYPASKCFVDVDEQFTDGIADSEYSWYLSRVFAVDAARKEAIRLEQNEKQVGLVENYDMVSMQNAERLAKNSRFRELALREIHTLQMIMSGKVRDLVARLLGYKDTTKFEIIAGGLEPT